MRLNLTKPLVIFDLETTGSCKGSHHTDFIHQGIS